MESPPKTSETPLFRLPDLPRPDDAALDVDSIPFRTKPLYHHNTWARTFHSRPELYIRPESVQEVQKLVLLARRNRRRVVVVGDGHSPSDLTCTSAWMVDLRGMNKIESVKKYKAGLAARALIQAGITLHALGNEMAKEDLTLPNLGSIDVQSVAGAIATATHGSSIKHGLLSDSVKGLRIVLADGRAVWCSATEKPDLFRAALVSLGAIGIITEVEYQLVVNTNIEWEQHLLSLDSFLHQWEEGTLWTQAEFVRCWWMPYNKRVLVWKADKTAQSKRPPKASWYGGAFGFHLYHNLLWLSNRIPWILPTIEWFIFGMQYRFSEGFVTSAIQEQREGLAMDCLYSQFVNEWAVPLHKGPSIIRRLSDWINGDEKSAEIPFSSSNLWVHCPIEVRVTHGSNSSTRAFMDTTDKDGPSLYINATLYRAYMEDPPCKDRYYEAFEWLMHEQGGRPHWAKNFQHVSKKELQGVYGEDMNAYLAVRKNTDPDGLFIGAWHRRNLLGTSEPTLFLEEKEMGRQKNKKEGGVNWFGEQTAGPTGPSPLHGKSRGSEESFDFADSSTDNGETVSLSESSKTGGEEE